MFKRIGMILIFFMMTLCTKGASANNTVLQIHDIQGCSHISPYSGKKVSNIQGVVTHKVSNGFTMQSLQPDDKPCSSEGIFILTGNYPKNMTDDLVSVSGLVSEFTPGNPGNYNLSITEITNPTIKVIQKDHKIPEPVVLDNMAKVIPHEVIENDGMSSFDINEDGLDFYESLESMLVEIDHSIVVAPKNAYNEIVVLPENFSSFNILSISGALLETKNDLNPEKIVVKLPSSFKGHINVGVHTDTKIIGIVDYSYGYYKVISLNPLTFSLPNGPQDTFQSNNGDLTLATYNVENLSIFEDEKKFIGISRQIFNDLSSPDLLVLHEVMDDSGTADDDVVSADKTILKLVQEIKKQGGPDYLFSDAPPVNDQDGGIAGGNIRSVLLYRQDRGINLEPAVEIGSDFTYSDGKFAISQNPLRIGESSKNFSNARKPAIWLLKYQGMQFFVVGVHLTSQIANSPDWGSRQPPLKQADQIRVKQSAFIQGYLRKILRIKNEVPIIVAGDMNSTPWSEVITALKGNSFTNTGEMEDPAEQFSYIFEGNAQQLDYILINNNLVNDVIQSRFLHLNTIQDHDLQVSDHDPVVIEINFSKKANG
jgi:predicted extracellular nuclease